MSTEEGKAADKDEIGHRASVFRIFDNRGPKFGSRHIQVSLMFVCMSVAFAMRTNLSIAIVAMTDNTTSPNPDVPAYDWDNTSVILSSFFWGYIVLQVLAGYLGKTYGPKYFLLGSYVINTICFTMIPLAADSLGSMGVIICRIGQGLSQGFLWPSTHNLLGRWAPTEERSRLSIIVYSGVTFGTILSSIVTGYVSSSWMGWPLSFYLFGALGVSWCIMWLFFGHSSPAAHPGISKEEQRYIELSLGQQHDSEGSPPWMKIFMCIHFWAIVVANIGNAWGYNMLITEIPTYLTKVMKFDIKSNGVVNAIPPAVGMVSGIAFGQFADFLSEKKKLTTLNARRIFHVFGCYGQAICLVVLGFITKDQAYLSILLLAIAYICYASTLCGASINHIDLSPRFSGIMQGFSNGVSQSIAIFSPLMVNFVVKDQTDGSSWKIIFFVAAGVYVITSTLYAIFASASRQSWDSPMKPNMERIKKASVISISGF
ncbi:putative inorganic phosphate cotransporter [Cylas formicarius]|uniref:putative inorganic phosphate cotransporter n=1 Tax=Cylas formicarius TaxID=197179 RepID=UPI002958AADD|nr:putative inorganic phosphate cotransporter [Cylas formicarius]